MRGAALGLVVGVVVGFLLPSAAFGVGASHTICSTGREIGWSGALATPDAIAMAPPGGFVVTQWWVYWFIETDHRSGEGGFNTAPVNSTSSWFDTVNWTLSSIVSSNEPGWGTSEHCLEYSYGFGSGNASVGVSGCGGCPILPPVPQGIGNRLNLPDQFSYGNLSSVMINASYGPTPDGTFSWHMSGNRSVLTGLTTLPVNTSLFYQNGAVLGLAITLHQRGTAFGIPFQLASGGTLNLPASLPTDISEGCACQSEMWINNTYILPIATDQGTWNVYWPGEGGPFSPAGLLFIQTAGP